MSKLNWMPSEEFRAKLAKSVRPVNVAIRKAAVPDVEVVNDEARTIKFVLSDENVDRDKDTVSSKGWDLANYKRNPVVLWAHDYEQLPIGRAISVGVEGGQLKAVAEFMPADLNPLADTVYRMLKGGWLKGNSVGFKPKDFDYNAERKGVDFKAQELMEFSIVPVPSHPGALAEAKSAGVDLGPVRKWAVETLVAVQKAGLPPLPATGAPTMVCPKCGTEAVGMFCPKCHAAMVERKALDAVAFGAAQKCPKCGAVTTATNCPKCGAPMPVPPAVPAKAVKSTLTGYGDTPAATHEYGAGDPLRDAAGCENGPLCPKMANQPCPLAEGCPMQKGAVVRVTKRGRMISAANESTLRTAAAQINGILDRLTAADQASVMGEVGGTQADGDPKKAWPPGSNPTSGTGFPDQTPQPPQNPLNPQQQTKPPSEIESAKVTASAGLMVAFLANLAAQTATLLEQLSPMTGDPNADDEENDPEDSGVTSTTSRPSSAPSRPFPGAKGVVKTIAERDGKFLVLADDGAVLGTYATRAEALAAVEAKKSAKSPAEAVEEFLLEIADDVPETVDLGNLTLDDLADVIKTSVQSRARASAEVQDRIRRGRVD